jgi:hypothetical protein
MDQADDIIPREVRDALEEFAGRATEIVTRFVTELEALPIPPRIYHHTNEAGLLGILRFGTLWLTDIFDLNDPSELRHGFKQATKILTERAETAPRATQSFVKEFEHFLLAGGVEGAAHFFVCSFSKWGDELGQWRAYADNGRGFSLGFDTTRLEDAFTKDGDGATKDADGASVGANSTFAVTYDDEKLAGMQRSLIDAAFPLISRARATLTRKQIEGYVKELFVYTSVEALRQVLFFKHHAYQNEGEFRFLQVFRADKRAPTVLYRDRPYTLVRYRQFDWRTAAEGALRQIIVGPSADPIKAPQFARDCLRAFHPSPDEVEIVVSEIPYRAA